MSIISKFSGQSENMDKWGEEMTLKIKSKGIDRNNVESVVIAGNGKSLSKIEYSVLPERYDVFRCNQFYFEDKYYLGKNIKAVFFTIGVILEQYYTLYHLVQNEEYMYENIILSSFNTNEFEFSENKKLMNVFIGVTNGYEEYLSKLEKFDKYLRFREIFEGKRITSGVYMAAVAVAAGYKDIYLVGIDFYTEEQTSYAFEHKKNNILKLIPSFNNSISQAGFHNENTDIEALLFLKETYDVNFYSISSHSPMSKYFPLPDFKNDVCYVPDKKINYIDDILLPPKFVYKKLGILSPKKKALYSNVAFRFFKDLLRLPSAIKHYLREK
ncbi:alpha-2,3-sialyltransferase [Pasteurella canis]|uniref:alpha-2,3-sialyltransferase n=1 Tax=Pasteurella canis TaxID=753 RepID=UPI001E65C056|nr:alpha-2,3-sialyltransferase [Pasteurella canis]GJJ80459.1 alpha-2,3-sialyltransferase [Pasteurella canis]